MADYSKSTMLLIAATEAAGETIINKTTLKLDYTEGETEGRVYHDGYYGKGRVKLNEIDENELKADGVGIWKTWRWGEGIKK